MLEGWFQVSFFHSYLLKQIASYITIVKKQTKVYVDQCYMCNAGELYRAQDLTWSSPVCTIIHFIYNHNWETKKLQINYIFVA